MKDMDLDRLHASVEDLLSGYRYHRGKGYTFAYHQLMLGERFLADDHTCFMYIGETYEAAQQALHRFVKAIEAIDGPYGYTLRSRMHVHLPGIDQDYFFVGLEDFLHPYAFMGTRIDRIFLDVSAELQAVRDMDISCKLEHFSLRGTDLI
jgi:hypothetical protein